MNIIWNSELYHYGMPRRSGRYKWGSGKNPFHHGKSARIAKQKKKQRDELSKYKQDYNKRQQETIRLSNKDKDFIRKTANSKLLYKYRDQFDDKELRTALNRINTEKDLREVRNKDINRGKHLLYKKIMSKMVPLSKERETTVATLNRFEKGIKYAKKHTTGDRK